MRRRYRKYKHLLKIITEWIADQNTRTSALDEICKLIPSEDLVEAAKRVRGATLSLEL